MLYIFNSAFRRLYTTNTLNTIYLPNGYNNEYRYRSSGEPLHVPADTRKKVLKLRKGTEAIICFIDRFAAGGYVYHPIRRGTYLTSRENDEYLYLDLKLGEFLYPQDSLAFSAELFRALTVKNIPRLTGGDPENRNDGSYVILTDSEVKPDGGYKNGEQAWTALVERLSDVRAFASNPLQEPVFIRLDVYGPSDLTRQAPVVVRKGEASYKFRRNKNYRLRLTYRFPAQRTDQSAKVQAEITLGDSLRSQGTTTVSVDSRANSVLHPFIAERYAEDDTGVIQLSPVDVAGKPPILIADGTVRYHMTESFLFWPVVVVALLVSSVAGTFIGMDLSKVASLTVRSIFSVAWPKFTASIIQTCALLAVFRMMGKKIL